MTKQKFSVLIPVYKKEISEYFDAALKSVFLNTILPDEVVICADGPLTPELDDVINKYEKKYPNIIKTVRFTNNRGLGLTLHDGVLECSNETIFRMDADDLCVKDRFEKQLDVIAKTNVDVLGSNITEYDETMKNKFGLRKVPQTEYDIAKYSKRRNPMNHMTVCFKKSKVIEAGNYQDMKGFEDYYLWIRMIKMGFSFYNIQESLVNVRAGESMVGRRGGKGYLLQTIKFEKALKKNRYISYKEYFENVCIRLASSMMPNMLRNKLYKTVLRGA